MRKNINNWKVINNKLPLFGIFSILAIVYIGCKISYWYLLFLILLPFIFKNKRINVYQLMIMVLILGVFALLVTFWDYGIVPLIKQNMVGYVRQAIFNFYDKYYPKETASFIKLILFNVKSNETYYFYKQTVDLGIVWLFCISGFHISLLSRLITKIFKRIPNIGRYVNISIIAFYSYLLNFSYASLRILLKLILQPVFFNFKTERFDKVGMIGLIICMLNPCCFKDYGFLLSFLICIGANLIAKLEINNKIISTILINILAFVITIPFVVKMNNKISLFTFINSFIFGNITGFIFLYFLLFSWMPFMQVVHHAIIVSVYAIIGNISFSNAFIYCKAWQPIVVTTFYLAIFAILKIIYLIVINNKI